MRSGLLAGAAYFVIVFAAGFVLGAVRTLWLAPVLGDVEAVLVEIPVMLLIAWMVCRAIVARLRLSPRVVARAVMGGVALGLLLAAEAALAVAFGTPVGELGAVFATAPALLGLAAQVVYAAFPLLVRDRGGQGA